MKIIDKLHDGLNKKKQGDRASYLAGVYKQVAASKRGRVCTGEFDIRKIYDSEQRDALRGELARQLYQYGLGDHAERVSRQKYVELLSRDGSGGKDSELIEVELSGAKYAFRAGEIRDLQIEPDADLTDGKRQLTEAYRVLWSNEDGQSILEPTALDQNKSRDLADEILGQ